MANRNRSRPLILIGVLFFMIIGCAAIEYVGGPITENSLIDGTYEGMAKKGPVKVLAKVTIDHQRIANIELVEHRNWRGGAAETIIPDRIIDAQSTRVDVVSGATLSSAVIMNAVEDAVRKAR